MWPFNNQNKIGVGKSKGVGAIPDPVDVRDLAYEPVLGASPLNWEAGYDVEKKLNIKINIKDQNGSQSCVGNAWAYYVAILNAVEIGTYHEVSAKAIYSQIFLPNGGAYIRDGAKLIVNFGALGEFIIPSYLGKNPPTEEFMRDKGWLDERISQIAKVLQAKEYRSSSIAMETVATAIRDNYGCVGGVNGANNGTWSSGEPKPPAKTEWGHCLYFGKYGIDKIGKYISTPNSWGARGVDQLHPDGWQKLREDYFKEEFMFNPWTLVDKPNITMSAESQVILEKNEGKLIIEGEGVGRKGIVVDKKLRQIIDKTNNRATASCLYLLAKNGYGVTVPTKIFNEIEKGENF